jgi:hypothetical protein
MSESRPEKRKVEFIESYWTGGEFGSDYQWNDNHGELIRCKDCKYGEKVNDVYMCGKSRSFGIAHDPLWFCADGEGR